MYKYIFFDLDGTITDSGLGITNAIVYSLKKLNYKIPDISVLNKYVGPPLRDSYKKYNGMTAEEAEEGVRLYREYYSETGLFECVIYDGIPELLAKLSSDGYKVVLATSKPEQFSIRILEHFDLLKYFHLVAGATFDKTRVSKSAVIQYALDNLNITDTSEVLMIGDRHYDINGAKAFNIQTVGVTYGYGDRPEHEEAGADYIVDTVDELYGVIYPGI